MAYVTRQTGSKLGRALSGALEGAKTGAAIGNQFDQIRQNAQEAQNRLAIQQKELQQRQAQQQAQMQEHASTATFKILDNSYTMLKDPAFAKAAFPFMQQQAQALDKLNGALGSQTNYAQAFQDPKAYEVNAPAMAKQAAINSQLAAYSASGKPFQITPEQQKDLAAVDAIFGPGASKPTYDKIEQYNKFAIEQQNEREKLAQNKTAKTDATALKTQTDLLQQLNGIKGGRFSTFQQGVQRERAARNLQGLLSSMSAETDPKKRIVLTEQNAYELARGLDILFSSGSQGSVEMVKHLVPQSIAGNAAKMEQYIKSKPQKFLSDASTANMAHSIDREQQFFGGEIKKTLKSAALSMRAYHEKDPSLKEDFRVTLQNQYGVDPFEGQGSETVKVQGPDGKIYQMSQADADEAAKHGGKILP